MSSESNTLGVGRSPEDSSESYEPDLGKIFSRALEIYRENPVMVVPSLIPIAALVLGVLILTGLMGVAAILGGEGVLSISIVGGMFLFLVILIVLFLLAEGVTIEMVREASSGRKVDLRIAWESSKGRMEPLVLSSILAGILTALGYLLFVIPGVVLTFALYFVAQAVMIDKMSGMQALKASYRFVEANLFDSVMVIIVSMAISILLSMIPVIGTILGLASMPYIYGLATLIYMGRGRGRSPVVVS
ncbi:MAG: hypothetical protein QUS08_01665 [Methanothrix sp.]|nr:hypothetical protein [Methanothrix sp.]